MYFYGNGGFLKKPIMGRAWQNDLGYKCCDMFVQSVFFSGYICPECFTRLLQQHNQVAGRISTAAIFNLHHIKGVKLYPEDKAQSRFLLMCSHCEPLKLRDKSVILHNPLNRKTSPGMFSLQNNQNFTIYQSHGL